MEKIYATKSNASAIVGALNGNTEPVAFRLHDSPIILEQDPMSVGEVERT